MNKTGEARMAPVDGSHAERERWEAMQREFLALLVPVLPKLSRFCLAMCRGTHGTSNAEAHAKEAHAEAKDLASETILKAWENFERLREPAAFLSYLFTVANRIHRHERVKRARSQPFSETDLVELADEGGAPDARADVDHLYQALAKLPTKQRDAIVMSEITGLKLEEVAQIQGASLSAVKTRVSRGRKKLAKLLGVNEGERVSQRHGMSSSANEAKDQHLYRFAFEAKEKL